MTHIDPAQFRYLLDKLDRVQSSLTTAVSDLGVALHNPLWLQVLIGILSSLGSELLIGGLDLAADRVTWQPVWVRTLENGELPVPDNFFDR